VRILSIPTRHPFNVLFPLREKGMVLSGRLRELFNRPFKVVFPCGKAEVLSITVYPIPFFPLFHRARLTLSPCDLRNSVNAYRSFSHFSHKGKISLKGGGWV